MGRGHLEEDGEIDDNYTAGHEHILRRDVGQRHHQTVGNGSAETAIGHDELIHLGEFLIYSRKENKPWRTC